MWTIRQEQMDAFRQDALQRFEDQMVEHLKEFAARHWQVMGELDGRKVIRLGLDRAKEYGFTNQGPVRFYTELMFMFGSYFDTDPQYPWAAAALRNTERSDQMNRADHLYDAMVEYRSQVSGPGDKYLIEAMQRFSREPIEDREPNLEEGALHQLKQIYPQKYAYLGEPILRTLIQHAIGLGHAYGIARNKGEILMAAFIFTIGYGFPRDPLYGWLARRWEDKRLHAHDEHNEQLHCDAMICLKQILAAGSEK